MVDQSYVPPRRVAPILAEIELYLLAKPMGASTFGSKAMGDPRFVSNLRDGRDPSSRLVERAQRFVRGEAPHA